MLAYKFASQSTFLCFDFHTPKAYLLLRRCFEKPLCPWMAEAQSLKFLLWEVTTGLFCEETKNRFPAVSWNLGTIFTQVQRFINTIEGHQNTRLRTRPSFFSLFSFPCFFPLFFSLSIHFVKVLGFFHPVFYHEYSVEEIFNQRPDSFIWRESLVTLYQKLWCTTDTFKMHYNAFESIINMVINIYKKE